MGLHSTGGMSQNTPFSADNYKHIAMVDSGVLYEVCDIFYIYSLQPDTPASHLPVPQDS